VAKLNIKIQLKSCELKQNFFRKPYNIIKKNFKKRKKICEFSPCKLYFILNTYNRIDDSEIYLKRVV